MTTNEQLKAAHDLLANADKDNLTAVVPKLQGLVDELDAMLENMLPTGPNAMASNLVKKARDNTAGAITEAQYLLDQFPKDGE